MPSTYDYSNIYQTINNIATTIILYQILKWIIIIALLGVALYFIIRTTCKYQAKKNAEAFDYDYLAVRTAEEITKRIVRLEQQKAEYKGATDSAADQSQGNRTGDPEQNGSQQE